MNNDTVMYIAVAAAVLAVIAQSVRSTGCSS